MLEGGLVRVSYGDDSGGRYVIVAYSDIKDHVLCRRPRTELIALYDLADDK